MNTLEERIRELRQRYAQTLPDRLASIAGMLMQAGERSIARTELLRQFHTLAGTAGTFGYEDIATLAREAERVLSSAQAPDVTPEEVECLVAGLVDLDAALRRHVEIGGWHGSTWSTFEGGGVV
jgi:HPt (histidine-containing phosphotransfer) domain-containing protein